MQYFRVITQLREAQAPEIQEKLIESAPERILWYDLGVLKQYGSIDSKGITKPPI